MNAVIQRQCQGQDGVSGERGERRVARLMRIDPGIFLDLGLTGDVSRKAGRIDRGRTLCPGSFAAGASKTPSFFVDPGTTPQPSSSRNSRASESGSLSPGSRLPPGCMKLSVPRLRTSRTWPCWLRMRAATISITARPP